MNRALFFVNSMGIGGAERVCVTLANALGSGWQCDFITLYAEADRGYSLPANSNEYCLGLDRNASITTRIKGILSAKASVNHFIKEREIEYSYSLITSHLPMSHVLTRLSCVSKRAIYVMHNAQWPHNPNKTLKYRGYIRAVYSDRVLVCVSSGIKDELVFDYGLNPSQLFVIFNPIVINADEIADIYPPASMPYILMASRLTRVKRIDRGIRAFLRSSARQTHVLLIIGEGEARNELEVLIDTLGVSEMVKLMGFQENPHYWMRNADLLLSTSDSEAFPVAPVEALLTKTPVVLSDCDYGPREILTGRLRSYLVSPVDDIDRYARAIDLALRGDYPFEEFDALAVSPQTIVTRYLSLQREGHV